MSQIQQSDITITKDGRVFISFLWDDLYSLTCLEKETCDIRPVHWKIPEVLNFEDKTEYKKCSLCPKECGFDRVRYAHPSCGDSKLRVSNVGISFGDEPLVHGLGGSGCIMLSGCPLTCPSCHNPEKVSHGKETTTLEFLRICQGLLENGAENIQILSPTVHIPVLINNLKILKEAKFPLPIIMKSSGYESVVQIKKFDGLVDFWLPDFKFGPCSEWGKKAGVSDYFEMAKESLKVMVEQVGIENVLVRHVLAPLPEREREIILDFLNASGLSFSLSDTFVVLE
jgi:putative pyruvate formate lyase activating enzyme